MAQFSSGGDEDGEGPSSYCVIHGGSSGSLTSNGDGSVSITLTDPQLVDCETLAIPVFQVPNERELASVKRKAKEYIVSEAKTKRKKKKQLATRPACSWVYFSREYIKEYSASHPESTGLKAATKAASNAWKLMSLEEKAKYARQAREVWDKHLSTAPSRTPKPRKQAKLITRCSPGRLLNVLQCFTSEQKDAVKSMGFGSLLGLRCRTLRRSLCLWLLERFNTSRRSLEICGEQIPLNPKDVEYVMGLAASGKDVVNSGPHDVISDLRHSYNATNRGISVRLLEQRLAAPEAGEDFKRSFILYALGTLLSPTARLDVSPSFLHFLTNMGVVHQYNWGKFLLDRLVREVSRYRQGKQRAVGGCLLFLQLFYYERISVQGSAALFPVVVPCLSSWGEDEITEREKRERELGGYGYGEVICKERCLPLQSSESCGQQDITSAGTISNEVDQDPVLLHEGNQANEEQMSGEITMKENSIPVSLKSKDVVCGAIELIVESVRRPCRNNEYGCNESVDCMKNNGHEETCIYAPCTCPILDCNFIGSSEQLSQHFSCKHWDSGRRFRYNSPLAVSLGMREHFLILQAEDDGALFLLNKAIENIGSTVMITSIGPSSLTTRRFMYDLVLRRGNSSLRLTSLAENFPGQVKGFPPVDFLLVPTRFLSSSGQLNLDVCIWNNKELGLSSW
ncbi:hypothetical protein FNV43_RR14951 [Rhamnella rubrinervis]|uniref:RING-type E3 ubiquitin transferase n=1 Tax=Rhamnella rubrinervis TaxID=2594499 RepID=A0A8K0H3V0_9ROSA|nr:hypothetical protein FNV43_RR14951 [Rhamnella rubrinervis]